MPDDIVNPRAKNAELEDRIKQLEQFCKDLIIALQAAEKTNNKLFLLPEGTYFGKRIE